MAPGDGFCCNQDRVRRSVIVCHLLRYNLLHLLDERLVLPQPVLEIVVCTVTLINAIVQQEGQDQLHRL